MEQTLNNGLVYNSSKNLGQQQADFITYYHQVIAGVRIEAQSEKESIGKNPHSGQSCYRYTKEVFSDGIISVCQDKTYQEPPTGRRALALANDGLKITITIL